MELGRRLGLLRPKTVVADNSEFEVTECKIKRWEEAFLGKPLFQKDGDVYATLLELRNDPSKKIYASMIIGPRRASIDIPLMDHTPRETLAQEAYKTTFFGEVVPEEYRAFATGEFTRNHLLAMLNRKIAGVSQDETSDWFYTTFGVKHLKPYGSIYIGSHGGLDTYGYVYNATIEPRSRTNVVTGKTAIGAIDLAEATQRSLPHISVSSLPVDSYLRDVQSTLKFLPRDWELPAR